MENARLSFHIFGVVFLLAMFGIGRQFGGCYSGIATMALAASSPHILNFFHSYYLDFPQAAFTALAFYLLLKSDSFKNRGISILLGIVLAAAFLTKWYMIFFMIIPILWFFIPVIIKSKKSFLVSLAFLIPFSVMAAGALWFYRNVEQADIYFKWFTYYLFFILIPGIICIISVYFIKRRLEKADPAVKGEVQCVQNSTWVFVMFLSISMLWFFWAAPGVKPKYFFDLNTLLLDFSGKKTTLLYMIEFFKTSFNLSFILIPAGVVYLFLNRENLSKRLVLPVNVIVAFFLMVLIAKYPETYRYTILMIIFTAALAGHWVAYTGKAKAYITSAIVLISLASALAWTLIPGGLKIFKPVKKSPSPSEINIKSFDMSILCQEPPCERDFDFSGIIDLLDPQDDEGFNNILFYNYGKIKEIPELGDYFKWRSIVAKRRVERVYVWNTEEKGQFRQLLKSKNPIDRENYNRIKYVVIYHLGWDLPEDEIEKIMAVFPGASYKKKTIKIRRRTYAILLKLKR